MASITITLEGERLDAIGVGALEVLVGDLVRRVKGDDPLDRPVTAKIARADNSAGDKAAKAVREDRKEVAELQQLEANAGGRFTDERVHAAAKAASNEPASTLASNEPTTQPVEKVEPKSARAATKANAKATASPKRPPATARAKRTSSPDK